MKTASKTTLLLALTTFVAAVGVYALSAAFAAPAKNASAPMTIGAHRQSPAVDLSPTASEFADDVVGTTTAYANAHARKARITNVRCVKASAAHYMCSYALTLPRRARECHLMQATWTPDRASTYTVTLAGRVSKCGSLKEAIHSLR